MLDNAQAMLNFEEERFLAIQAGAVAVGAPLGERVRALIDAGASNLFFLGAGGAGVLMEPAARMLQREGRFPVHLVKAAEMMAASWSTLGSESIVVIPSLSGSTTEAVDVLAFAQERGATVMSLTGHTDSPVAQAADYNFTNFAEDDTSSESFYVQSLLIALAILDHEHGTDGFSAISDELTALPGALLAAKRAFEPRAEELARQIKDESYHLITGAGPAWTEAWYYATCILEEMQWIRTRPIHAADFFHGTLELVEPGVSVLVFKGEDASRGLAERVEAFLPRVTDKATVLDAAAAELPGISASTRQLLSHVVLATWLERLSAHLGVLRDHPLTIAAERGVRTDAVSVDATLPTAVTAALVRRDGERAFASDFGCQRAWGIDAILGAAGIWADAQIVCIAGSFNLPGLRSATCTADSSTPGRRERRRCLIPAGTRSTGRPSAAARSASCCASAATPTGGRPAPRPKPRRGPSPPLATRPARPFNARHPFRSWGRSGPHGGVGCR